MSATLFIYPWLNTGPEALWDLRYSLRSIDQHFGGNYQVLLLGDRPQGFGNGLWHTRMERLASDHFPRCLDVCTKMEYVLQCPWVGEEFVHIHDDQLLLQDMGIDTLRQRVARNLILENDKSHGGAPRHSMLVRRTYEALRAAGVEKVWNYETHLPRVFEKRKMAEVFERFKPTENRLLYSTLYYNWHYQNQPPEHLLSKLDHIKAGFYRTRDAYSMDPAPETLLPINRQTFLYKQMLGKRFLNYNDKGRTADLLEVIKRLYPTPGGYEVAPAPTRTTLFNLAPHA